MTAPLRAVRFAVPDAYDNNDDVLRHWAVCPSAKQGRGVPR